jgi:hypothetical protein
MSLINEALKRAREVPIAPAPELHFRPVEQPPVARRTVGLMLPVVVAGLALLALLLVWQLSHRSGSSAQQLSVAPVSEPSPTAVSAPPVDSSQAQPARPAAPAVTPPAPAVAPPAPENVAAAAPTNSDTAAEPPPPAPPPLKLQGVVFNPKRPSALISGKTVFVGDRIRDFRVVAISADSATLMGAGQTNVLSLSE